MWDEPRPSDPPPRSWRDWALVGTLVPLAMLEGVLRSDLAWPLLSVAVTVGLTATLLWRRTKPLLMVAIAFATTAALALLSDGALTETHTIAYLLLLPYSLFRWGSGPEIVAGAAILLANIGFSVLSGYNSLADGLGGVAVVFLAGALGGAFRFRAGARTRELDQVKLLERERLARDLHDTVAHHVSAMAIRAQAGLAISASQPDAAAEALRVIEAEASRTLTEMRTMVRVLRRNQPADLAPGRGVADLHDLARPASGGPAVDVAVVGELDDLTPPVGAAVYRLAQEAVTNARRHARHATRVEVRAVVDDTSVHLHVSDDGDTSAMRSTVAPGYGLLGMVERAHLLGGTCQVGPNPDRGWTVTAVLPRSAEPGVTT
ncbi:histidine kinase [Salinactinospora qingdaonensis]|uniref:histidine kinase n=1 Tax=Salinactinospora qingdaonensis TaxID=702744 RepID=A0ABP7ET79_9ACTN